VTNCFKVNQSYCYSKQSATRDILKELHISDYSFPIKGTFLKFPVWISANVPIAEHSYLSDNCW